MQKLWRASWIWDLVLLKSVGLCTVGSHCSILPSDELALIPLCSAMSQRSCAMKLLDEGLNRLDSLCAGSVTPLPQPGNDKPRSFRLESLR